MRKSHELLNDKRLFYAFVKLDEEPVTYIVPSRTVAKVLQRAHQAYVATPGRGGKPHKPDTTWRWIAPDYSPLKVPGYRGRWLEKYRERWDLLHEAVSVGSRRR